MKYIDLHHNSDGWWYLYICGELVLVTDNPDTLHTSIGDMCDELETVETNLYAPAISDAIQRAHARKNA